ncbi:hypothetical protein ACSQ67_026372 [Phaseolus vulgaris]
MSRGGNNMTKLEAVEYLKEVRMRFEDKEKFMEFLKIITEYRFDWFVFMRDRFEDTDDTYKAFVKILTDRNKNGMSIGEVYHEASVVYVFVCTN